MAIAFDASAQGYANSTSVTFSHTCTGSDRILFVGVGTNASDRISGATYNGTAMTQVAKANPPVSGRWLYLFMLVNPDSGTNNIVVSSSPSGHIDCASASYIGAEQTGQPDATQAQETSGTTSITTSVTTTDDNCWTVNFTGIDLPTVASTGATERTDSPIWSAPICDSNGAITPAGSTSMTCTYSTTSANNIGGVMASFSPAVTATSFSPKVMMIT